MGAPPLLPISLLKILDAVIEPARNRMTLRDRGVSATLTELPSGHQTASMMHFDPSDGWNLPREEQVEWMTPSGKNPFLLETVEQHESSVAVESRLDVDALCVSLCQRKTLRN